MKHNEGCHLCDWRHAVRYWRKIETMGTFMEGYKLGPKAKAGMHPKAKAAVKAAAKAKAKMEAKAKKEAEAKAKAETKAKAKAEAKAKAKSGPGALVGGGKPKAKAQPSLEHCAAPVTTISQYQP